MEGQPMVTMVNGSWHIEGYPDASSFVLLKSETARRLSGLRIHEQILQQCSATFDELPQIPFSLQNVRQSTIAGIAISFFSCFGRNSVMAKLRAEKVFKGMPDARKGFEYWKAVRDNHISHNVNEFTQAFTGLVLRADGEVQDVLSINFVGAIDDDAHLQLLYNLIQHTLKYVQACAAEAHAKVLKEGQEMSPSQRQALEPVVYRAPLADGAFKERSRL